MSDTKPDQRKDLSELVIGLTVFFLLLAVAGAFIRLHHVGFNFTRFFKG